MGDRITEIFAAHVKTECADPMPLDGVNLEWWLRSMGRHHQTMTALRLAQVDEDRRQREEDEEVARLCEAEVFPG